jgi:hypothetical protein
LNWSSGSGGSGGKGSASSLNSDLALGTTLASFFMRRGGAVPHMAGGGRGDDDASFTDRWWDGDLPSASFTDRWDGDLPSPDLGTITSGYEDYQKPAADLPLRSSGYTAPGSGPMMPIPRSMTNAPTDNPDLYRMPSVTANGKNYANDQGQDTGQAVGSAARDPLQVTVRKGSQSLPETAHGRTGADEDDPIAAADTRGRQNAGSMQGRTYEDQLPYPHLASNDKVRSIGSNPWMALAAAGAGALASGSPWPGVAIGKGAQAGITELANQRKEARSEEEINQRAKQLAQTAEFHRDEYSKLKPADILRYKAQEMAYGAKNWQSLGVDWDNNQLFRTGDGEIKKVNAANGTIETLRANDAGVNPAAPTLAGQAGAAATPPPPPPQQAQTAIAPPGGKPVNDEPASMLDETNIGAQRNLGMLQGYGNPNSDAAKRARAETAGQKKEIAKAALAADGLQTSLQTMKRNLDTVMAYVDGAGNGSQFLREAVRPGIGADKVVELAKAYERVNHGQGVPENVLSALIQWNKESTLAGYKNLINSGMSGREAVATINASQNAVARSNQPEAAARGLIENGIAGASRAKTKLNFFDDYTAKNNGISSGWEDQWDKAHPASRSVAAGAINAMRPEEREKLGKHVTQLRGLRDEFMAAEKSGDPQAAAAVRQKWEHAKKNFDLKYGGTSNYFTFGTL